MININDWYDIQEIVEAVVVYKRYQVGMYVMVQDDIYVRVLGHIHVVVWGHIGQQKKFPNNTHTQKISRALVAA